MFHFHLTGPPGDDAKVPRLSFSAALTQPQTGAGTIVFNKVFVNEVMSYNPHTGTSALTIRFGSFSDLRGNFK